MMNIKIDMVYLILSIISLSMLGTVAEDVKDLRVGYLRFGKFSIEEMSIIGNFRRLKHLISMYDIMLFSLITDRETMELLEICMHPMQLFYTIETDLSDCRNQAVSAVAYRTDQMLLILIGKI